MSIHTLAADLASRVPAMMQDTPLNNAEVIQGLILTELQSMLKVEEDKLLWMWKRKCDQLAGRARYPQRQNRRRDNHGRCACPIESIGDHKMDKRIIIGETERAGWPISAPAEDPQPNRPDQLGDIRWVERDGHFSLEQFREYEDDSNPWRPHKISEWVEVHVVKGGA